jgi:hypothetical protein
MMCRIFRAFAIAFVAIGCTPTNAPTATVNLTSANASSSSSSSPTSRLNEDGAIQIALDLPETKAFEDQIKKAKNGHKLAVFVEESPKADCKPGIDDCRFHIFIGEDANDHVSVWNRFEIDAVTHDVWVYDVTKDVVISIAAWRQKNSSARKSP